jgi:exonuclease VII small subunit
MQRNNSEMFEKLITSLMLIIKTLRSRRMNLRFDKAIKPFELSQGVELVANNEEEIKDSIGP